MFRCSTEGRGLVGNRTVLLWSRAKEEFSSDPKTSRLIGESSVEG